MTALDRACPETWRSRAEALGWRAVDLDLVARVAGHREPEVIDCAIAFWDRYDGSRYVMARWQPPTLSEHQWAQRVREATPERLSVARCLADSAKARSEWVGESKCSPGRCGARRGRVPACVRAEVAA